MYLQRRGVRADGEALTLIGKPTRQPHGRVGLTVSKKVGNAVVRNRVKRRLRDLLRHRKHAFANRDLIVLAKDKAATRSHAELADDLDAALRRLVENEAKAPPPGRGRRRRGGKKKR